MINAGSHPIQTVFFDLGSTLVYYNSSWPGSLNEVLDPMVKSFLIAGIRFDETKLRDLVAAKIILFEPKAEDDYQEPGAFTTLKQIMGEISSEAVPESILYQAMRAMYLVAESHWTVEAEAIPVLDELRGLDFRLGIISNAADHEHVENVLNNAGIYSYFDCVITSALIGTGKPGTEIFSHALKMLSATPDTSVMVGDKLQADILGANRMGMRSIWVTRRANSERSPGQDPLLQPWKTVSNLKEIPPILKIP